MDSNATVPGGAEASYSFALWNLVIRPPRAMYHTWQLGPPEFTVNGVRAVRRDFKLQAKQGGHLACSQYFPQKDWDQELLRKCPVVVYLHGNSSNRLEAGSLLGPLLMQGISLVCFDSAGCGHSDGEYISLGWHERDDLASVLEYLRQSPFCGPIGLWGRSMGAVTALLHADRDQTIGAICLDSPFVSLRNVVEDLAMSAHIVCPLPSWVVSVALAVIRMRVKALANFDIEDVMPLEHAKRSYVPAIFMHAEGDTFISPQHSRQLYDAYLGDKEYLLIEGDHNSERSDQTINRAVDFFRRAFRLEEVDLCVSPGTVAVPARPFAARPASNRPSSRQPRRSATPPVQPRRVSPQAPPNPPTPPVAQPLPKSVPKSQAAGPSRSSKREASTTVRIDFSSNWQAVLEAKLEQAGLSTEECRSRLLVYDNAGVVVNLFSGNEGSVPGPSRFPLRVERRGTCARVPRRSVTRGGG